MLCIRLIKKVDREWGLYQKEKRSYNGLPWYERAYYQLFGIPKAPTVTPKATLYILAQGLFGKNVTEGDTRLVRHIITPQYQNHQLIKLYESALLSYGPYHILGPIGEKITGYTKPRR
jgi:hypothetical protein